MYMKVCNFSGDCGVASRVAHVLLVATHPDTSRIPRTPQGNYISSQAERLLTQLKDKFGTLFKLHQQVLVVDAHVSNSPGMKAIKSYLADAKQKVLQVCTQILNQFSQNANSHIHSVYWFGHLPIILR
jgi:hypothetical protein